MKSDVAGILAAVHGTPRIMVLGDDDRHRRLAWLLADALRDRVDLGVSHGNVAADVVEHRSQPGGGTLKVHISPRRGFWEADRFGTYDMLLLGGLEQCLDPLETLVHASSLDVRLLCVETGVLPSTLRAAAILGNVGTSRIAGSSLAPTVRRDLVALIDRELPGHAAAKSTSNWRWYMTAHGVADLLLRAGWYAFREVRSSDGYGSFFICRRGPGGCDDPVSTIGQERAP